MTTFKRLLPDTLFSLTMTLDGQVLAEPKDTEAIPSQVVSKETLSRSTSGDTGYESPIFRVSEETILLKMEEFAADQKKEQRESEKAPKRIYKLVLTGGPCGGKTTGQERLATFFENMGWKVFTVPETATILLSGGVKFCELTSQQAYEFQKDLLRTLIRIEDVFFNQASLVPGKNVLVICDRGAMDPSAYIDPSSWEKMLRETSLEQFSLKEDRYNQIVHLVTAADGAEAFYTLANNATRKEGLDQAIQQDLLTRGVWIGHPYVDIIDNSDCTNFDDKILKLIEVVCDRVGLPYQDRLSKHSKKRKWLVSRQKGDNEFPKFEEFNVKHDYLLADASDMQVRIRSRMQNNRTTYTITTRHLLNNETVETRMKITEREYQRYLTMKDKSRATLHKLRRCFNYGNQYYNLDMYVEPLPPCSKNPIMILETYTTNHGETEVTLPPFLKIEKEITGDAAYSMFHLARNPNQLIPDAFQGAPESDVFPDD